MYLVNTNSSGYAEFSLIKDYAGDISTDGVVIDTPLDGIINLLGVSRHPTDTYDNILRYVEEVGSNTYLQYLVCNSVSETIPYRNTIYSNTYDYRTLPYDWDGVTIDSVTDLVISIMRHEYQNGVYSDDYIGVGHSTLTPNVVIFTEKEEFYAEGNQSGSGSPEIWSIAKLKVWLSLDGGSTLTDISSRLNPTFDLDNTKYVVDHWELDDATYTCDTIYWTVNPNGRLLCGVQPPYNKHNRSYGGTTRFHISYNYGATFEDEHQIIETGNVFYLPVCNNMGANGNILLGKYFDSFEDSYTYDNHLQLSIYNIHTKTITAIPDVTTLSDWSFYYYKPSTYAISGDGNTVIVGGTCLRTPIAQYKMVYFKIDISNVNNPSIVTGAYYPTIPSVLGFGVSKIITNF
jgi:hypothetical protein